MNQYESASERRMRLVREHGYNGLATLTLYDGWRYFEPAGIDGFVAYELHRKTAVACGDPVCDEADAPALMRAFAEHCAGRGWRFSFVGASARAGAVANDLGFRAIKIGEEPFFALDRYSTSGRGAKKVRSATNLARRTGVTVQEYRDRSPAIDSEVEEVAREWLESRRAPAMGFLLRSRPLALREHKRVFLAWHEGRIAGVLTCSRAPARGLLYVEEQVRRVDAPYGTSELLIDEARKAAQVEGLALLSLGTSPLQGAYRQPYGKHRALTVLFRAMCLKVNFVYSFRSQPFQEEVRPHLLGGQLLRLQGQPVARRLRRHDSLRARRPAIAPSAEEIAVAALRTGCPPLDGSRSRRGAHRLRGMAVPGTDDATARGRERAGLRLDARRPRLRSRFGAPRHLGGRHPGVGGCRRVAAARARLVRSGRARRRACPYTRSRSNMRERTHL